MSFVVILLFVLSAIFILATMLLICGIKCKNKFLVIFSVLLFLMFAVIVYVASRFITEM